MLKSWLTLNVEGTQRSSRYSRRGLKVRRAAGAFLRDAGRGNPRRSDSQRVKDIVRVSCFRLACDTMKNQRSRRADRAPGRVETIPLPSWPLDRHGGVAIEDADAAGAVQVQHGGVVDVSAVTNGGGIPGDAAGVFDCHGGAIVVDAAAVAVGGVAGQGAAADRQVAVIVD